jgi:hypothetical protein
MSPPSPRPRARRNSERQDAHTSPDKLQLSLVLRRVTAHVLKATVAAQAAHKGIEPNPQIKSPLAPIEIAKELKDFALQVCKTRPSDADRGNPRATNVPDISAHGDGPSWGPC